MVKGKVVFGGRKIKYKILWLASAVLCFPVVSQADLIGYREMDDSSGSTAADSATADGTQVGTLLNFPTDDSQWTTGQSGGVLDFSVVGDVGNRVEIADATVANYFDPWANFTWATWVKTPSVGAKASIISFAPPGGAHVDGNLILTLQPPGAINLLVNGRGAAADYSSSATVDDNLWHHVAVTVQHDTMEIDVYDDACLAAQIVFPSEPFAPSDFDKNCITDLRDYAILAEKWLVEYAITEPVAKP